MAVHEVDKDPCGGGGTRPKVLCMIKYCQARICRRQLFSQTLDMAMESDYSRSEFSVPCTASDDQSTSDGEVSKELCDNCRRSAMLNPCSSDMGKEVRRVVAAVQQCVEKSQYATGASETAGLLTLKKISGSTAVKSVVKQCSTITSPDDVDYVIAGLLEQSVLRLHYHYTPYSTLCYIVTGYNFHKDIYTPGYISSYFLLAPDTVPGSEPTVHISRGTVSNKQKRGSASGVEGSSKRRAVAAALTSSSANIVDLT